MGPYSYLAVNVHYSSRLGMNDPEGDSEIIKAPSLASGVGSGRYAIALVSTDRKQPPGASWDTGLPSIA